MLLVRERIACRRVLKAHCCNDIASGALLTINAVIRIHLENATQALTRVLVNVIDIAASVNTTRVHAEIC